VSRPLAQFFAADARRRAMSQSDLLAIILADRYSSPGHEVMRMPA
jgi:hypothetical protein